MNPLYRHAANRVVERAAELVAVSSAEADQIRATFPERRVGCITIPNALDIDDIHAAQPFIGVPPTVVVIGRLEQHKRVDKVIEAFGRVRVSAQLMIVGQGPRVDALTRLARASPRAADIHFTGYVDRRVLVRWLRTARVLVSLSEREAFDIVAYEGAASGANVLLSPIPAHRAAQADLPDDVVTLATRDVNDVARRIEALLSRPDSGPRELRAWPEVATDYRRLFARLVG